MGLLPFRGRALTLAQMLLVVAPAFMLFGYNQSGVGGLLSINDWTETFPEIDTIHTKGAQKSHNSTVQGVVVATFTLGALFGALSCAWVGDFLGRRKTIFLAATLTLVGEVLQTTSFGLPQFIVGRTLLGFGVGQLSTTVPVWQSECSSAANRGKHVVLDGLFISFGYMTQAWVNLGFYQIKSGSASWRVPLALPCVISMLLMSAIFFLPESPRWLVRMGRIEEARRNLSALKDLDVDDTTIAYEISGIEYSLEETSKKAASMRDLFTMKDGKLFYRFMLCIMLQFFQQMSGGNLISVYSTIIFQQGLGLDSQTARILSGGTLTWKFLSCFVAFFTVDRFGRRILFMVSGTGMALCMMSLCICTSFPTSNTAANTSAVVFVFLFNFFIPIGFLGANFLYCTEIAPIRLRVAMSSISTANHWLWNFVVLMITPVAISSIGYKYYILYTLIGICIPLLVFFFYPETMGQNLEKLDMLFMEDLSIRAIVKEANRRSATKHVAGEDMPLDAKAEAGVLEEFIENKA